MKSAILGPPMLFLVATGNPVHSPQCAAIEGTIFNDSNRNGYQDAGETGLQEIRVTRADGWTVRTDQNGVYRVACADTPPADIGSKIVVKVDTSTLPKLYELTTQNPRLVLLQAGKTTHLNFGASIDVVRLRLWDESFHAGRATLTSASKADIDKIIAALREGRLEIQLIYVGADSETGLVQDRIRHVEELIASRWRIEGRHTVTIRSWRAQDIRVSPGM